MKIAIDVSQMCYEGTGVARYVSGLSHSLLEAGSKHKFLFYAGVFRRRTFFKKLQLTRPWDQASWRLLPLPPKLAGLTLNLFPIRVEWLIGQVDLIHTSDWTEPSTKLPSITTIHDLVFKKYPETVDPLILKTQTRRLLKIVKNNTQIIVDSLSTKNDLMEIYGIKSERIEVVYPGLNIIYKPQSKKEIERVKKKYNLPDQYIFSLGTQEPRKNLARLVEATATLTIPLVIAGRHGWGGKTHTLGFVPEVDLPALYSGASVFAFPSLYEGFGFPVLEAMACGTPVVTSNISSLPEVAGKAGILVDPLNVDSIRSGIKQALAAREKLIPLGLRQSQQFTWGKTAKQVLDVYEKIIYKTH